MSGLRFVAQTAKIETGTSKITLLQLLAPANQRVKIKEISVSFDGQSNTAQPVNVELLRQSDAGSGGDSLTLRKLDPGSAETLQSSALADIDGSSQPTDTEQVLGELVHPQGGYTWQAPFGGEIEIPGGGRIGLAVTAAAGVQAKARFICEE